MVSGWTRHVNLTITQGTRFLLPLGSADRLLPGLFLSKLHSSASSKETPSPQSSCAVFDRPASPIPLDGWADGALALAVTGPWALPLFLLLSYLFPDRLFNVCCLGVCMGLWQEEEEREELDEGFAYLSPERCIHMSSRADHRCPSITGKVEQGKRSAGSGSWSKLHFGSVHLIICIHKLEGF